MCPEMFIMSLAKFSKIKNKKTHIHTFIRTALSWGEIKRYPVLQSWSLFQSSSNLIICRYHTFSEKIFCIPLQFSATDPCKYEWPWLLRGQRKALSSNFFITSMNIQCIQHGFPTRFKRAWDNSDYFPICLLKLPRAIISEMAGQVLLDPL